MRIPELSKLVVLFIFCAAICSSAQTFTTIANFNETNGSFPTGPLVLGLDGNYYGTTLNGGTADFGTIFQSTPDGALTTLYSFLCSPPSCTDGYIPQGLVLGGDGNFYGVTYDGGINHGGTFFKVTSEGVLTTLYAFCGLQNCADGGAPNAPLLQGRDGNFYGTTNSGGGRGDGGTVFKITPSGALTTLHNFCSAGHCLDGQLPATGLAQGRDGNFYGTTPYGGTNLYGIAFRITPTGVYTLLHAFDQTDGAYPKTTLIQGTDGNFYGMTYQGGSDSGGTVFKMTPAGTVTVLASFNGSNGQNPMGSALVELGGNFYGTTVYGGGGFQSGTIFEITPTGLVTDLYTPPPSQSSLMLAPNGVFYGEISVGGTSADGTLFTLNLFSGSVEIIPASGDVGIKVVIRGSGLSGATGVSFNGTAAKFMVVNGSEITAMVPIGAVSGPVIITSPAGTLASSVPFLVNPQIKTFTPESGPIGTTVTITGASFTQAVGVAFSGIATTAFMVGSDAKLTATVPSGAATGPITITTAGGTATSTSIFTVTP
jgi:uncharacterized repeat protein (TIGR03803 family)